MAGVLDYITNVGKCPKVLYSDKEIETYRYALGTGGCGIFIELDPVKFLENTSKFVVEEKPDFDTTNPSGELRRDIFVEVETNGSVKNIKFQDTTGFTGNAIDDGISITSNYLTKLFDKYNTPEYKTVDGKTKLNILDGIFGEGAFYIINSDRKTYYEGFAPLSESEINESKKEVDSFYDMKFRLAVHKDADSNVPILYFDESSIDISGSENKIEMENYNYKINKGNFSKNIVNLLEQKISNSPDTKAAYAVTDADIAVKRSSLKISKQTENYNKDVSNTKFKAFLETWQSANKAYTELNSKSDKFYNYIVEQLESPDGKKIKGVADQLESNKTALKKDEETILALINKAKEKFGIPSQTPSENTVVAVANENYLEFDMGKLSEIINTESSPLNESFDALQNQYNKHFEKKTPTKPEITSYAQYLLEEYFNIITKLSINLKNSYEKYNNSSDKGIKLVSAGYSNLLYTIPGTIPGTTKKVSVQDALHDVANLKNVITSENIDSALESKFGRIQSTGSKIISNLGNVNVKADIANAASYAKSKARQFLTNSRTSIGSKAREFGTGIKGLFTQKTTGGLKKHRTRRSYAQHKNTRKMYGKGRNNKTKK